jgi:hypothetical protein
MMTQDRREARLFLHRLSSQETAIVFDAFHPCAKVSSVLAHFMATYVKTGQMKINHQSHDLFITLPKA